MIIYHASPRANLTSILDVGTAVRFSQGSCRRTWFHVGKLRGWAQLHTAARHNVDPTDVVVFKMNIPVSWLHRHAKGVYWCDRDVPPAHIESVQIKQEAPDSREA